VPKFASIVKRVLGFMPEYGLQGGLRFFIGGMLCEMDWCLSGVVGAMIST